MNATQNNAANDSIRFAVIASCMTPRGAWAKSIGGNNSEYVAREQFANAGFLRPEGGIVWGQTLTLVKVTAAKVDGAWKFDRETIATRVS